MATLLCSQFTCPPQDNPFLTEDDLGMYIPAQPAFLSNETAMKVPTVSNSDLDDLLAGTSSDILSDWLSFPDFLSNSSPDFKPDTVYPLESTSNYSSSPSSPSISLAGQEPDELFQILDGNHPASCSPNAVKPSLDAHFYPTLTQPSMSDFFPGEMLPSCDSPNFVSSPSPTPPPSSTSSPIKEELPVLTSLLGKRPPPSDRQSASKALVGKQQRIRKKLPHAVMKQRKKEQNKDAALRYRQRKKEQQDVLDQKCQVLEKKNSELKGKVNNLTREIVYLRNLLQEVEAAKRQKNKSRLL